MLLEVWIAVVSGWGHYTKESPMGDCPGRSPHGGFSSTDGCISAHTHNLLAEKLLSLSSACSCCCYNFTCHADLCFLELLYIAIQEGTLPTSELLLCRGRTRGSTTSSTKKHGQEEGRSRKRKKTKNKEQPELWAWCLNLLIVFCRILKPFIRPLKVSARRSIYL